MVERELDGFDRVPVTLDDVSQGGSKGQPRVQLIKRDNGSATEQDVEIGGSNLVDTERRCLKARDGGELLWRWGGGSGGGGKVIVGADSTSSIQEKRPERVFHILLHSPTTIDRDR
jgi:hypothetical protein